jgi:hypothetical protein
MANKLRLASILIVFGIHPSVGAATLTSETKAAWEAYLQEAIGIKGNWPIRPATDVLVCASSHH